MSFEDMMGAANLHLNELIRGYNCLQVTKGGAHIVWHDASINKYFAECAHCLNSLRLTHEPAAGGNTVSISYWNFITHSTGAHHVIPDAHTLAGRKVRFVNIMGVCFVHFTLVNCSFCVVYIIR